MSGKIKIRVERRHIDKARAMWEDFNTHKTHSFMRSCSCPIALALKERFSDATVFVRQGHVDVCDKGGLRKYSLSRAARLFVKSADRNLDRHLSPETFVLSPL